MNIETVSKRYVTDDPNITKVVIMNVVDGRTVVNRRIHYEVCLEEGKRLADDYLSALTTLYF